MNQLFGAGDESLLGGVGFVVVLFDLVVKGGLDDLLDLGAVVVVLVSGFGVQLDEVAVQGHRNIINFII